MPHKSRFSLDTKKQAVEDYLSGRVSINGCALARGVSSTTLRDWIRLYETYGIQGLIPVSRINKYSEETKFLAVEEYLEGKLSQVSLCKKYNIKSPVSLRQWIKLYNNKKIFKRQHDGGNRHLKGRNTTAEERIEIVSHCISIDRDYKETIEKYKVSYNQIYKWVKKYDKNGADGLIDFRGKRKNEADMTDIEKLKAKLKLKEAENLRLKMENDLLKKLEALGRG